MHQLSNFERASKAANALKIGHQCPGVEILEAPEMFQKILESIRESTLAILE